ncbi:MAG TPA: mitofilin family membrane protein [Rickettsiales bacterium]|nr:mitofilin family membrane protein [Rickettsiales bacterium]
MENADIEKEIIAEKKSISHLRIALLVFLLVVTVAFAGFYNVTNKHVDRQMVDTSVLDARLQNIDNAVSSHERRLEKVEQDLEALSKMQKASTPEAVNALDTKVTALEKDVHTMKPSSGANAQTPEQISHAIGLISVFFHLSSNITSGKPFIAELNAFENKYGKDDQAVNDMIATVAPYADSGIPTTPQLLDSFDDAADSAKRREAAPPENAGFWQKLVFNLSHMITIRRIDQTQKGNSTDMIIGRAEDHLNNDEISAAITEINALPENIRGNFAAWLEDARIAEQAPAIIDSMEEKVMKKAFAAQEKTD